ncbi:cupin domain-containing protein [Gracilimonas sediminicola]|uniref:cupin domain-containing protein n=1 Tax=Gracilimonas sediminicola TaxID=2952158 RepID=UPI0038D490E6
MKLPVNLTDKFKLFDEYWTPKIVEELNDQYIKLAKLKGEFVWHSHDHEDELFYIVKGQLKLKFRDNKEVILKEGEMYIVQAGVEHFPVAEQECWVMLMEPKSTLHTGSTKAEGSVAVEDQEWI